MISLISWCTSGAPMPAFSDSVKTSARSSSEPRISEFPTSLKVGAAYAIREAAFTSSAWDTHTFLDIPTKVEELPAYCRVKDMGDLLLGAIVSRHDDYKLRPGCCNRRTEDGSSDKVGGWYPRQESVELSCGDMSNSAHLLQYRCRTYRQGLGR